MKGISIKHFLTLICMAFLFSPLAHAAVTINIVESGGDVIATTSGSINTTGLTFDGLTASPTSSFIGSGGTRFGIGSSATVRRYSGTFNTVTISNGAQFATTNDSGNTILYTQNGSGATDFLFLPTGYVSNGTLNGQATWTGQTIAGMSLIAGTHVISLPSDTITLNIGTADVTNPTLQSSTPADNATGVSTAAPTLSLTFDEAVVVGSGLLSVHRTSDNVQVNNRSVTGSTGSGTANISITFENALAANTEYYVLIPATAFDDTSGNSYAGISSTTALSFTTAVVDTTDPTLQSSTPADNATAVAVGSNIVLTFDETVFAGTGSVEIYRTSDSTLIEGIPASDSRVTGTGTSTITVNPASDLANSTDYYIEIEPSAFQDASANFYFGIANNTTLNFTTAAAADVTDPLLDSSDPQNNETGTAVNRDITLEFNEAVNVEVGNITIKTTIGDTTIETIDVTGGLVTGDGTTTITVNPTSDLAAGTEFYVLIDATAFDDAASNSYAGISSTTALSFTTAVDTTDPTLQSSTPADNATGVAVGSNIVLTFDEVVNAAAGNIVVRRTSDNSGVAIIASTDSRVTGSGSTVITVNLTNDLAVDTEYYVLIDATAFEDTAGNPYAGISSTTALSFTTASTLANPFDDERVAGLIQAQTQTAARVATQALGTVSGRLSQLIASSNDDETANNSYQGIKLVLNLDPNIDSAVAQTGLLSGLNSSGDIFHNGWAVWTEGSVIVGKGNGHSDFHVDGITIGVDKRITPSFTAGVALRAAQEDNDVGATEKVDTDAYSATLYGSYILNNNSYLQGAIGYSDIDFSTKRTDDTGTLSGDRDADQVYMSLSFTREFNYKGFTLLPYGSFDGSYSTLDSYSETGTGTALTYHEQDVRTLAATIGLRGRYFIQQSNGSFVPRFHINYKGDLDSDDDAKVSYVSVPSTTYSSSFDAISSSAWLFGVGFDYQYNNLNFSADYERTQEINWGYSDALKLKLEATF